MTREEFVRRLIVNSMCDDFENVDQVILREVAGVAAKCGLTIERPEVVQNLRALVDEGMVKAYDLSTAKGDPFEAELDRMPPLDTPEEYFQDVFLSDPDGDGLAQIRSDLVSA